MSFFFYTFFLWVGAAPLPDMSVHLVRVNDPHGVDGFDVNCGDDLAGAEKDAEPMCEVEYVRRSKRGDTRRVSQKKLNAWLDRFFAYVHPKDIQRAYGAPSLNPPVGGVQLVWKVQRGDKLSQGTFKRPPNPPGVEYRSIRAILALEDAIWHQRKTLP